MCTQTNRIVLKGRNISLNGLLDVTGGHQGCCQVDVAIDEVRLQSDGMAVVLERLLQLVLFFVNVAKVAVRFGQQRILLDGKRTEVSRPR